MDKKICHEVKEEVEDCDGIVYLDKTRQENRTEKGILRCCKEDDGCVLIKGEKAKIGWDFQKKKKIKHIWYIVLDWMMNKSQKPFF